MSNDAQVLFEWASIHNQITTTDIVDDDEAEFHRLAAREVELAKQIQLMDSSDPLVVAFQEAFKDMEALSGSLHEASEKYMKAMEALVESYS